VYLVAARLASGNLCGGLSMLLYSSCDVPLSVKALFWAVIVLAYPRSISSAYDVEVLEDHSSRATIDLVVKNFRGPAGSAWRGPRASVARLACRCAVCVLR
jgi:hypothetical protein